ncbi:MAG: drug/metabolite transporter (DMT)-like permease [Porticoccaceae bacterium]
MSNSSSAELKTSQSSNNLKGVLWALIATALFALAAAMAKVAVKDYHILQILFFRQLVVFLSSLPFIASSFPASLKTQQPLIHTYRLIGAFIALSGGIWAVSILPLTTATTLGFAQVFFISLLAWYFLNEPIGTHRLGAVALGFLGVILVMRPGFDGILNVNVLIPTIAALGASVAIISVRKLSQTESTATLLVYQALFVGILAGIPLFWLWVTPDLPGLLFLMAMGVLAAGGQWTGVIALRLGEASVIGSIQYVQLIYAAILGFILFCEVPDRYTLLGAAIIISASLYLMYRESLSKKKSNS